MGRHRTSIVRCYFTYDAESDTSKCTVPKKKGILCGDVLKGDHAGNLERHLHTIHPKIWQEYVASKMAKRKIQNVPNRVKSLKRNAPPSHVEPIKVHMTYSDLENAILQMVTEDGCPFTAVQSSGFKKIINPILKSMNCTEIKRTNKKNVKNMLLHRSEEAQDDIKRQVYGRMLSLKIDCAMRGDQSFMCISVHYKEEGNFVVYLLVILDLNDLAPGESLKDVVITELERYNITLERVYSITTDNVPNILRAIDLLYNSSCEMDNKVMQDTGGSQTKPNEEPMDVSDSDDPYFIDSVEEIVEEQEIEEDNGEDKEKDKDKNKDESMEEDEDEEEEEKDDEEMDTLEVEKLVDIVNGLFKSDDLPTSRCAAQYFEVAVMEALQERSSEKFLNRVRAIVKKLQSKKCVTLLESNNCNNNFTADSYTKWSTTYDMLKCVLLNKEYIATLAETLTNLRFTEVEWETMNDLMMTLKPCKSASDRFQAEDLTIPDFYKIWTCVLLELKNRVISTKLATDIVSNMEKLEVKMFQNPVFASNIFLDGRFKYGLDAGQQELAKKHITSLYKRITQLEQNKQLTEQLNTFDSDDDLVEYLGSKSPYRQPRYFTIEDELNGFLLEEPVLYVKSDVIKFWHSKQHQYPKLSALSNVILAVPANVMSVERLFNQLRYLLDPFRGNVKQDVLSSLLNIRRNVKFQ